LEGSLLSRSFSNASPLGSSSVSSSFLPNHDCQREGISLDVPGASRAGGDAYLVEVERPVDELPPWHLHLDLLLGHGHELHAVLPL